MSNAASPALTQAAANVPTIIRQSVCPLDCPATCSLATTTAGNTAEHHLALSVST